MAPMSSASLIALLMIIILPLVLGIVSFLIKSKQADQLIGLSLMFSIIDLIILVLGGELTFSLPLAFLGETISLSISKTAVALYGLLLIGLGVLIFLKPAERKRPRSRFDTALIIFSMSFGGLAFFSNQFMIRYIALEVVGLLAALAACRGYDREGFQRFANIFLTLRIGDIGLLVSILLILPISGTLAIPEMIETATALPLSQRSWVVVGLVLAGLVKKGVIPFAGWQERAWASRKSPAVWISGFLMPGLGMYLLYRVSPILASDPVFRFGLPVLGLVLVFAQMIAGLRQVGRQSRFGRMGSVLNAFVLLIAGLGSGTLLRDYFLVLLIGRLVIFLSEREGRHIQWRSLDGITPLLNISILTLHWGTFPVWLRAVWIVLCVLVVFWDRELIVRESTVPDELWYDDRVLLTNLIEKIYQTLEVNLFSRGLENLARLFRRAVEGLHQQFELKVLSTGLVGIAGYFGKAANWLRTNFELGFDRIWAGLGKGLIRVSTGWLTRVETGVDDKAAEWTAEVLEVVDQQEQELKTRPMHRDLVWVPILMLCILIFLFIFQGG